MIEHLDAHHNIYHNVFHNVAALGKIYSRDKSIEKQRIAYKQKLTSDKELDIINMITIVSKYLCSTILKHTQRSFQKKRPMKVRE